jgi:head-tail adaptor
MSIDYRLRQTVTILNPGTKTDEYNNTVPDWDNPTTTIEKGLLEPTQSTEVTVGRDTVISDFLLFLKVTSAITALSRVQVAGVSGTFEAVGLPAVFDQGSAGTRHVEARLVGVSG